LTFAIVPTGVVFLLRALRYFSVDSVIEISRGESSGLAENAGRA
jgi:hypothetical protein